MRAPLAEGMRFGRLVLVDRASPRKTHGMWHVRCDCGTEKEVRARLLRDGITQSCGCLMREVNGARQKQRVRHGHARQGAHAAEYDCWVAMRQRCSNPRNPMWHNYGGRGIQVCARWINSFENFLADVGHRPGRGYSLDRIDNDRGYEPGNVRWATAKEQGRNTRRVKLDEVAAMQIRWLINDAGLSPHDVGAAFGVVHEHVRRVAKGCTW